MVRDRLKAGRGTLNPLILVRIQVPEPEADIVKNDVFFFYTRRFAEKGSGESRRGRRLVPTGIQTSAEQSAVW